MANPGNSVVRLVELADHYDVADLHASASFNVMRDVFHDRLKSWIRPRDQWRSINHNRACVILQDIGSEGELELAAAKLGRVFREPHVYRGKPMHLHITAGFAEPGGGNQNMTLAMRQAAMALNQAKNSSRLYEVFSPGNTRNPDAEAALIRAMDEAMETGEFNLYYQPQVHAGYNSLVGAEALLRWHRANGEIITPDSFIEVAERHEIIRPLTWWVIKSAVARLAKWPEQLSIAVNVSPVLLLRDDIQSVVHDALDIFAVSPERLNLEVTEKIMVDNQEVVLSQLHNLRERGVKISIDDFGTGFSSLAYFRDLPVDEIKIDQCFVHNILSSEKDHAIVKAVIDLAHNFSMRVVAEGVETPEIAERLSQMRCDVLQGYFFDRPLQVEHFEQHYKL